MLPKSLFPESLVKHLFLFYNGRFESTQSFAHLLFNQLMWHTAIRKVAWTESTNKKYLQTLGDLLKREDFKEALKYASKNPDAKDSKVLSNKLMWILNFIEKNAVFSFWEIIIKE